MTKKSPFNAEFAARIAAEVDAEEATPLAKGDVLASRARAMSMMSADIEREQFHWIDPALCRPSSENARHYEDLTYAACEELINSIKSEGRQRFPAVVRRTDDEHVPYEIVAGSRRHWAISWLRANSYPDFRYLVDIQDLDDEAAFRISDIENRAREDVTDMERAESYAAALEKHYANSLTRMAERIGVNSQTLRRYIWLAELPKDFVNALGGAAKATVSHARSLKPEIAKGDAHLQLMLEEAQAIIRERAADDAKEVTAAEALRRIIAAPKQGRTRGAPEPIEVSTDDGVQLFSYTPAHRSHGITIKFPGKAKGSAEQIKQALMKLVDERFS